MIINKPLIEGSNVQPPKPSMTKSYTVKAIANGACTAKYPVGLYYDQNGALRAKVSALEVTAHQGNWGIVQADADAGTEVTVVVKGLATVASGGTAGNLVSAITNVGVVTDGAPANGSVDNALGVSLSGSTMYI